MNRVWVGEQGEAGLAMGKVGQAFFGTGGERGGDWRKLRDRWERSHLIRALLMTIALVALAVALTL